jgi:Ku70/Ku80 beta-barrel domain
LVLENLALRHQLAVLQRTAPRPRLRISDRLCWVLLSRLWSGWTEAVFIVQPATVVRWQRTGFKLFWTWKSRRTLRHRSVYFEDTYYLGAGKNGERGYRVLVEALEKTHRIAVGTFAWRGKTTPIAIRVHQDGLFLQRLYFAGEVHNAAEIDRGAEPKIRDQERTLAERLIDELAGTEFTPENYEDEYRKRLLKAIEQKVAGQEIQRVEVEARPPTTDLVATLKASLGRKGLAKAAPAKAEAEPTPAKRPARRRRAS